jgi:crossover junction endodeoxyribonuclease RuvC
MINIKIPVEKIILSIDPGYERLGLAILKKDIKGNIHLLHSECFKTQADIAFADRLCIIGTHVTNMIQNHKPTCFAIESLFLQNNQKTVMKVSETRGVLIYIAKSLGLQVYDFTPLQIKSAVTGSGRSDKISVQKMVILQVPDLKHKKKVLDDEYDAIACGLTYFALEKSL